jgi:hypothetical protein
MPKKEQNNVWPEEITKTGCEVKMATTNRRKIKTKSDEGAIGPS